MAHKIRIAGLFLSAMFAMNIVIAFESWPTLAAGYPDFTIFYSAAKLVRQGHGNQLFDQSVMWRAQHAAAPEVRRLAAVPFMHAPFEALLFIPFTFLPLKAAFVLWDAVNLILLLWFAQLVKARLRALRNESWLLPYLFLLGFFPIFNVLLEGQDVIILLLLYAAAFRSLHQGDSRRSGAWLGLGWFRVHLILPILVFMALLKRWRFVGGFLLSAIALAVVSVLVTGWREALQYPAELWDLEHRLGPRIYPVRDNPNLRGLLDGLLGQFVNDKVIAVVVGLLSVALIAAIIYYSREREAEPGFELHLSVMIIATVLLSYHTLFYDYTLLALPILIVCNYVLSDSKMGTLQRIALLLPAAILCFTPLYMLFWIRHWEGSYLMAITLIIWMSALLVEISHRRPMVRAIASSNAALRW